ncbi:hypothetical protein, partial [Streptomyces eurythermus]|uniref:hypothetical protein n=1 Tax=Streptomyces eurythermus TaxID=42237 RepID=UPI0033CE1F53
MVHQQSGAVGTARDDDHEGTEQHQLAAALLLRLAAEATALLVAAVVAFPLYWMLLGASVRAPGLGVRLLVLRAFAL